MLSMKERIRNAFKEDNERSFARDYLERLYSNLESTEKGLRQSLIRISLLIFISFLLLRNPTEVDLGFLKINSTIILQYMPLLISINYYELTSLACTFAMQMKIVDAFFSQMLKPINDMKLQLFLYPSSTPHCLELINRNLSEECTIKYLNNKIYLGVLLIILFLPIVLDAYFLIKCLEIFGLDMMLLITSLIALIIIIKSILTFIINLRLSARLSSD